MKKSDLGLLFFIGILGYVIFMNKKDITNYVEEKISGINNSFDDVFKNIGKKIGISPRIIKAVSANESSVGLDKRVEKIGNTQGVMHVIYDTAKRFYPNLKEGEHRNLPLEKDVEIGAKYLSFLFKKYNNTEYAIKAYNGGEGRMNQIIAYQKTKTFKPIKTGDTLDKMLNANKNMTVYWERYQRNYNKLGIA